MAFTLLTLLALGRLSSVALDSNLVSNPGFETGTSGWKIWANAADSGRIAASSDSCHGGSGCLALSHEGSKDWAVWPSLGTIAVHPGEVWGWTAWTRAKGARVDASLGFVLRDSSGGVLGWNASATGVGGAGTGWTRTVSRLSVPKGCATIQPRIVGYGPDSLWIDDASFVLESAAPTGPGALAVVDDSVRLEVEPYDLSMRLVDLGGADTVAMEALSAFHLDSAREAGGGLVLSVRHLAGGWPAILRASLTGGAALLSLEADSASPVPGDFAFPGTGATRAGQRVALARGTGLAWPVEGPASVRWEQTAVRFWEWQASQSLTGATDGRTGFVVSLDQPADAWVRIEKDASGRGRPVTWQAAAKGVFGHARSALVAPLRGGGFAEMARRHRARQEELGQVRTWAQKVASVPATARLRGAADWWVNSGFSWRSFDTLRWMGMEKALLHWTPWYAKDMDSLRARGWLLSVYDNWADAFPGDTSPNGKEYATGAVVLKDGSPMKGWLEYRADGSTRQALEICSARHSHLARANVAADTRSPFRDTRFIDVEMAMGLQECWSTAHPTDRHRDLANRVRALSVISDSLGLVTGSEQAREASFAQVDYGEGPMSLASTSNAGYDWSTPTAPEGTMDSLSMDPAVRVPLLPLTHHDGFAPTWYTGDGQSKVPARWDDKDAWNILYATMPLIAPKDRSMWDSLRVRYLRSIVALGAFLERCQFEPMTDFVNLSADGKVQRTSFGNGWTATANFDAAPREEGGIALPAKGWRAAGPEGVVERVVLAGAVRTRVRLVDRWFLDPEGSEVFLDGVRTTGSVYLKRLDDSTVALTLVGDQDHVDLVPASLPWPATRLRATDRNAGTAVPVEDRGSGTLRLEASKGRFVLLRGDFGSFAASLKDVPVRLAGRAIPTAGGWELRWTQASSGPVQVRVLGADGRTLHRVSFAQAAGPAHLRLPRMAAQAWVRIETPQASQAMPLPRL